MAPAQLIFTGAAALILMLLYALRREETIARDLLACWGAVCFLYAPFILAQPAGVYRKIEVGIVVALGIISCGVAFALERLDRRQTVQQKGPRTEAVKTGRRTH